MPIVRCRECGSDSYTVGDLFARGVCDSCRPSHNRKLRETMDKLLKPAEADPHAAHHRVEECQRHHPTPWSVKYWQRCEEWDERSRPRIVDANGRLVCELPQHVDHPGKYDAAADAAAHAVCEAVNKIAGQQPADAGQISEASATYVCDEVKIDPDALVSEGDTGYWVSAWVWCEYEGDE